MVANLQYLPILYQNRDDASSAFTSRFPELVKALILSNVTRWAAVFNMKESKRKLLN
ncbi:hypothetical protein ACIQYG_19935 [Peribacillus sp. NPDC096622]|uniref:hypothetical protein n=1 Tax=Peribacillus sp. NPDC096622 TaxID=3364396 RepID=UPI00381F0D38